MVLQFSPLTSLLEILMTFRGISLSILLAALTLLGLGSKAKAGELAEQAAFTIGKTLCALKISNAKPEEKSELVDLISAELKATQPAFRKLHVKPYLTPTGFLFKVTDNRDEIMAAVNCASGSSQTGFRQTRADQAELASDGITTFTCLHAPREGAQFSKSKDGKVVMKVTFETFVRGPNYEPMRKVSFALNGGSHAGTVINSTMDGRLNWSESFPVTGQPGTYRTTVMIDNGQGTSIMVPLEIDNYDGTIKDLRCPQNQTNVDKF